MNECWGRWLCAVLIILLVAKSRSGRGACAQNVGVRQVCLVVLGSLPASSGISSLLLVIRTSSSYLA